MSALGLAEVVPTAEPLSIIDALEELVVSVKRAVVAFKVF